MHSVFISDHALIVGALADVRETFVQVVAIATADMHAQTTAAATKNSRGANLVNRQSSDKSRPNASVPLRRSGLSVAIAMSVAVFAMPAAAWAR